MKIIKWLKSTFRGKWEVVTNITVPKELTTEQELYIIKKLNELNKTKENL